jgi:hypothetical protein
MGLNASVPDSPNLPQAVSQAAEAAVSVTQSARAVARAVTGGEPPPTTTKQCLSQDSERQMVVVHLHSASRLPRLEQLNRSSVTPYVAMWVIDHHGSAVGERTTWAPRPSTREPVWNCAHDLRLPLMDYQDLKRSLLHVELWDHHPMLSPNPIGQVRCVRR